MRNTQTVRAAATRLNSQPIESLTQPGEQRLFRQWEDQEESEWESLPRPSFFAAEFSLLNAATLSNRVSPPLSYSFDFSHSHSFIRLSLASIAFHQLSSADGAVVAVVQLRLCHNQFNCIKKSLHNATDQWRGGSFSPFAFLLPPFTSASVIVKCQAMI